MASYILKRLLLMIPTLFGILLVTFAMVQFVPGGPVEQMVSQLQGRDSGGERAAASGVLAANTILNRYDVRPEPIWSVAPRGVLSWLSPDIGG